jgi:AraC-like DNA-binding protein
MDEQLNRYLYPIALVLMLAVSVVFTFKRKDRGQPEVIFLSLMYWAFCGVMFVGYVGSQGLEPYLPHVVRTGQIFALLIMPFSYLYLRQTLAPRLLSWRDGWVLLPLFVYLVDYTPFFFGLSGAEKLAFAKQMRENKDYSGFREGWFAPPGFHVMVRYLSIAIFWILQLRLLQKVDAREGKYAGPERNGLLRWLHWLLYTELILFVPALLNMIFDFASPWVVYQFSGILVAFIHAYFLLAKPEILYGWGGYEQSRAFSEDLEKAIRLQDPETIVGKGDARVADLFKKPLLRRDSIPSDADPGPSEHIETDPLREEWMRLHAGRLDEYLTSKKPFLKQGYSMPELAAELGLTTNQLSSLVNHHFGMHFNALINQHRVETCKEKLSREEYRNKTLEAIARESGFQSRATFINAFKAHTGKTPSAYIREMAM